MKDRLSAVLGRYWRLLVLLPAAVFYLHHWAVTPPAVTGRFSTYMQPASELLRGGYSGVETLRRTPVYPLLLAGTLAVSGGSLKALTLLQHLLALLTAWLVMDIAFILWRSRAAAALAGALTAFHPDLLYYARAVESELPAVFLLCLMLWLLTRLLADPARPAKLAAAAGLAGGAAALCRPELAVCALVPPLLLARGAGGLKRAGLFFAPFAALVGLWMVRNLAVFGYFSLSPMGAVTSLQTSGPLIDWDAPSHREFKALYRGLLAERGGDHRAVVNLAVERWPGGTQQALLEAAALGRETAFAHPLAYLRAALPNFADFLRSVDDDSPGDEGAGREAGGKAPGFRPPGLLYLALLGLAAAAFAAPSPGLWLAAFCALAVTAANCLVEIGIGRRSFELLPLLALFAGYLAALPAAMRRRFPDRTR